MSKDELVNAYLHGRLSRRMFVRGLVAAGVSVTAAVTYSEVLSAGVTDPPPRGLLDQNGDQYGGGGAADAITGPVRFTG